MVLESGTGTLQLCSWVQSPQYPTVPAKEVDATAGRACTSPGSRTEPCPNIPLGTERGKRLLPLSSFLLWHLPVGAQHQLWHGRITASLHPTAGGPCPKPHASVQWGGSSHGPIGAPPGLLWLLPLLPCAFFWVPSPSRVINASCYTTSGNKSLLFPIPW